MGIELFIAYSNFLFNSTTTARIIIFYRALDQPFKVNGATIARQTSKGADSPGRINLFRVTYCPTTIINYFHNMPTTLLERPIDPREVRVPAIARNCRGYCSRVSK